jgi:hypothetical protein
MRTLMVLNGGTAVKDELEMMLKEDTLCKI